MERTGRDNLGCFRARRARENDGFGFWAPYLELENLVRARRARENDAFGFWAPWLVLRRLVRPLNIGLIRLYKAL